jgi:hypothetical protein
MDLEITFWTVLDIGWVGKTSHPVNQLSETKIYTALMVRKSITALFNA